MTNNQVLEIAFDSQIFSLQNYGGISRYFSEIIPLLPNYSVIPKININYSGNQYIHKLQEFKNITYINQPDKTARMGLYILNGIIDGLSYASHPPQILHHTYFSRFSSLLPAAKRVITLYDTITPDGFMLNLTPYLDKVSKFIAISTVTKNSFINKYHIDAERIEIIHLASSLRKHSLHKLNLPKKYILFTGNRSGYKNFEVLYKAFRQVHLKFPDLYLVCGGGESLPNEFISSHITQIPYSTDSELVELISNAQMFVFPSKAEGFGIPILEAFSLGCPVLASDIDIFHEVAGKSCLYFDPNNPKDLAENIKSLLTNSTQKRQLIEQGIQRNKLFSWEKTAQKTVEVYRSLLK